MPSFDKSNADQILLVCHFFSVGKKLLAFPPRALWVQLARWLLCSLIKEPCLVRVRLLPSLLERQVSSPGTLASLRHPMSFISFPFSNFSNSDGLLPVLWNIQSGYKCLLHIACTMSLLLWPRSLGYLELARGQQRRGKVNLPWPVPEISFQDIDRLTA